MTVTDERLEEWKALAERLVEYACRYEAGGPFEPSRRLQEDAAEALVYSIAEVERLREAIERACNEVTGLQTGRRDTVLRLRAALALAPAPVDAAEEQVRSRRRARSSSLQPPKEGST